MITKTSKELRQEIRFLFLMIQGVMKDSVPDATTESLYVAVDSIEITLPRIRHLIDCLYETENPEAE